MERKKQLCATGYLTFFLSGICAISSGIIVSILQEKYGFSFGVTGTMLSFMNIGNMAASFASGILPGRIGTRATAALLCSGYFLGYTLMAFTGITGLLIAAFLLVGIAKGCTLNNCTVLVGNNSSNRTKGLNILHACYACGALVCSFVIAFFLNFSQILPIIVIGLTGLLLWIIFYLAKLPGRPQNSKKEAARKSFDFLRSKKFWVLTALVFCQNAAENSVTGWLVTYYKNQQILSGTLSTYTVTVMWGATLIARLLIAFVFPVKNTFRALSFMGLGCTVLYTLLVLADQPITAIVLLFAFAFAMAGVNPVAVSGVGKMMSTASMGIMLPLAGIGSIVMPWIIGLAADRIGLQAGMFCNLIPCIGILVLSLVMTRMKEQ